MVLRQPNGSSIDMNYITPVCIWQDLRGLIHVKTHFKDAKQAQACGPCTDIPTESTLYLTLKWLLGNIETNRP
ncbi:hypothetical protein AC578_2942 [Pseudocercospora eumusae]|uniref:Uncharacterized protein n=1 Tax=Pseudocercospora eumusae TaxID=321146 RepID=A0A139HEA1_9PEZI|nr:hypothetical protein AC578_2942 [Pseudocercospora eumusae]